MTGNHCWHKTGIGKHHWTGGKYNVICCHCGIDTEMKWELEKSLPLAGHGPMFRLKQRVDKGTPYDWSDCIPPEKI